MVVHKVGQSGKLKSSVASSTSRSGTHLTSKVSEAGRSSSLARRVFANKAKNFLVVAS